MTASLSVIISAKAIWAATKDADVAEKVRTASIIAKKCRKDMEICCKGGVDVLGPAESKGAGGTGGAEDAGDVGNGAMTDRAVDTGIWGSSKCTIGCG